MGDGNIEIQQAVDQPEIAGGIADLDQIVAAGIPSGRAGSDRAGGVPRRESAAVGDVDSTVNTAAFGQGAKVNVGHADNGPIVDEQTSVQLQARPGVDAS